MSKINMQTKPKPDQDNHSYEQDDIHDPNDLPPAYEAPIAPNVPITSRPTTYSSSQPGPSTYAAHDYPGAQYHAQQWTLQEPYIPPNQHYQPSFAPYNYPPGYRCPYCNNTGIKLHNGHPCGTCERNFGRQANHVQYAPPGVMPVHGGVTYMAGDPRIGGRLCGNCKGRGVRSSLFGMMEEQCYICRGVGRIL